MSDPFSQSPVLIWQMGKVGSTSIWEALSELNLRPIQLHVLDLERNERIAREHHDQGFAVPTHIDDALRLQRLVNDPDQKFKIISLVRDPVARNLSALFESWDVYPPSCSNPEDPTMLAEWFVMNFDYSILGWFDQEIRKHVGIDVYATQFDYRRKRLLIETDRTKILVLRAEDSQSDKERNIQDFLRLPKVTLGMKNVSRDKPRSQLWSSMSKHARVSSVLANIVYESPLVRHFYTEEEICAQRARWTPTKDGIYFEDPEEDMRALQPAYAR